MIIRFVQLDLFCGLFIANTRFYLSKEVWYKYPYPFFSISFFFLSFLVCEAEK